MGARFALAQQSHGDTAPFVVRRVAVRVEALAALLGAAVACLLMMAPLNLGGSSAGAVWKTDLLVLDLPQAAAAGAAFAMVSAALVVALGQRTAWIVSGGSAIVLLADGVWNRAVTTENLATASYIDCILSGILLGALAVAVHGKPIATGAYLIGALGAIEVGDQTPLPTSGGGNPIIQWVSVGTLPAWLLVITALLLAVGGALQHDEPATEPENTTLAIGPTLAVLVLVTATTLSTGWLVRHAGTPAQIGVIAAIIIAAAMVAALLLPGRDGTLVLLAVAASNAGSAIIAVPRPDWSLPLPVLAVVAGLATGRRWRSPWIALAATGGLAVFAALTADAAHRHTVIPVLGVTLAALIVGFCFGVAVPRTAGSTVVALAVMIVPGLVVALRGSSFGRVAYSPRWYRDPDGAVSAMPGWMALVITLGCAAAIYRLWQIRSLRDLAAPEPTSCAIVTADGSRAGRKTGTVSVTAGA
ncbi:hypothetical protein KHQ06_21805 [Nocardia tengchongensis]|uniref:Uncharacterized protein n=1 Tax=Nocardia tengchongensis TaxID=2055889 RepID=A0ABX8CGL2_9NOCA|nr:hypothetical protein [Nocardia tengchongensis]QVI19098.1 hypothetical protein KHQ06_21805 [Nocardia tengchongensis]